MKIKNLLKLLFILLILSSCNPYKGFKGVDKKGMKKNKLPSQELRKDYEKMNKKAQKSYNKQKKKSKKKLGNKKGASTPQ